MSNIGKNPAPVTDTPVELTAAAPEAVSAPEVIAPEVVAKPKAARKTSAKAKPSAKVAAELPVAPAVEEAEAISTEETADKHSKAKKPKLVRDSFTIPKTEYAVLDELKDRATQLALPVKKSELLRAGIKALAAMSDAAFVATLGTVPAIKTGRPKNDKV